MALTPQTKAQWAEAAFPVAYGLDKLGVGPSSGLDVVTKYFGGKSPNLAGPPAYNLPAKAGVGGLLGPTDISGIQSAAADSKALEHRFLAEYGRRAPIPQLQYSGSAPVVYADGAIQPQAPVSGPHSMPTVQQIADRSQVVARPDLVAANVAANAPRQMPTVQQVANSSPPLMARPDLFAGGAGPGMSAPAGAPAPQPNAAQFDPAAMQAILAGRPQSDVTALGQPSPGAWPARWGV